MGLNTTGILDALRSHAAATGVFTSVTGHEQRGAALAQAGVHCSIFFTSVSPAVGHSGLSATTARLEYMARLQADADAEPADGVETLLTNALDVYLTALSADFDLSQHTPSGDDYGVRCLDLLGMVGTPLQASGGYLKLEGLGKLHRMITVVIPVLVNDVWPQAA